MRIQPRFDVRTRCLALAVVAVTIVLVPTAVEKGATATRVIDNVSHRNRSDGIAVRAAGTLLARNVTNFNADLGIRAVRGMIDGGGNRAKGNGNPLQSTNISCS